jgi:hypothetical protein
MFQTKQQEVKMRQFDIETETKDYVLGRFMGHECHKHKGRFKMKQVLLVTLLLSIVCLAQPTDSAVQAELRKRQGNTTIEVIKQMKFTLPEYKSTAEDTLRWKKAVEPGYFQFKAYDVNNGCYNYRLQARDRQVQLPVDKDAYGGRNLYNCIKEAKRNFCEKEFGEVGYYECEEIVKWLEQ